MKKRKQSLDERCALMRERQAQLNGSLAPATITLEVPLTVQQAAPLWGQSEKATRRHFRNVHGVRIIGHPYRFDNKRKRHVQRYETILIPPSVLEREIQQITKIAA
jgi:hypothetical protein